MIAIFIIMGIITVPVLAFASRGGPYWLEAAVPIVAVLWWFAVASVPGFMGYAVDERFVQGRTALVLSEDATPTGIYVTVRFDGDSEPRLVFVQASSGNRSVIDQMQKAQKSGAPVAIRFGKKQPSGTPGSQDSGDRDDQSIQGVDVSTMTQYAK